MSDTPRTDTFAYESLDSDTNGEMVVSVLVARQLERELTEVTKQRDELVKAIRKHKAGLPTTLGGCDVELYEALEEVQP